MASSFPVGEATHWKAKLIDDLSATEAKEALRWALGRIRDMHADRAHRADDEPRHGLPNGRQAL